MASIDVPDFTPCPQCGHDVPSANMRLHQLRCQSPGHPSQVPDSDARTSNATPFQDPLDISGISLEANRRPSGRNINSPVTSQPTYSRTSYGGVLVTAPEPWREETEVYPPRTPSPRSTSPRLPAPPLSTSSLSEGDGATWACTACTYENTAADTNCDMCDSVRPFAAPTARSTSPAMPAPHAAGSPLPSGWDCPRCTMRNRERSSGCEACESPRPGATPSLSPFASWGGLEAMGRAPFDDAPSQPAPANNRNRSSDSTWECHKCTYHNDRNAVQCEMCHSQNPGAVETSLYGPAEDALGPTMVGGSLLGAAAGGILALMTGQRVLPNILQGAVTGAVGGAVVNANERAFEAHRRQILIRSRTAPGRMGAGTDPLTGMSYEEMARRFPAQPRPRAREEVISALPTETLTEERVEHLSQDHHKCPICMEDFRAGDIVKRLPCLHAYHQACIDEWLRVSAACPICKEDIPTGGI